MFKIIITFIVLLIVVYYVLIVVYYVFVHQRCTGKGKIVPSHAMEAYLKGGIAPLIIKRLYYMEVRLDRPWGPPSLL